MECGGFDAAFEMFDKRIVELNDRPVDPGGDCVLYWMQRSQRASDNPALKLAVDLGNDLGKPIVVYFGLYDRYPMASARAFRFMLQGLAETAAALNDRGIGFVMRREPPGEGIVRAASEMRACAVVVDEDYLNVGRSWRADAAKALEVRLIQVDSETVVPARISDKEQWGAYTLRPRITKALPECLVLIPESQPNHRWRASMDSIDLHDIDGLVGSLDTDQQVAPVGDRIGGSKAADRCLRSFIANELSEYASQHNEIGRNVTSGLSPYLHFGQISGLKVALAVRGADAPEDCRQAFLDQLIVRRELAINFCLFNHRYDRLDAAAPWARETLDRHRADPRPELYSLYELESARTHDDLWNAAQTELLKTGVIHNYMRMLWGKKLLEWSETPEDALERAIYLNDKYAIDGRDPNGYANIAWCILGKHDRPFQERPIYGKIRYMSSESTKRKYRWKDYVGRTL